MNPQQTGHNVSSTVGGKTTTAPKANATDYHTRAQAFIKSSHAMGMDVKAENTGELNASRPKAPSAVSRFGSAVVNKVSDALSYPSRVVSDTHAASSNAFADSKLAARRQLQSSKANIGRN